MGTSINDIDVVELRTHCRPTQSVANRGGNSGETEVGLKLCNKCVDVATRQEQVDRERVDQLLLLVLRRESDFWRICVHEHMVPQLMGQIESTPSRILKPVDHGNPYIPKRYVSSVTPFSTQVERERKKAHVLSVCQEVRQRPTHSSKVLTQLDGGSLRVINR